ncbi:unnamed protein product [Zymoseptoria tritici ST99CH_1A5]|uniref:Syntaxin N-terminal domain-containing protein n=4 Tax=Zymoseptoria tritici TaxID=1047171 RepID=F9WZ52_ZYMTI|nr:uncharacterized protein MYCGRDRAFT_66031 [Zymoseptoria tritici IPO323]SMQ45835.1 unnamed protein product [Zymoseptoria tritici ST99CH_3D7]SMR42178.1 unnamed protein product [Zymoseptoria tritici ST99CH_1E4]SMR44358.1 unnamed protein product [Zymoseptoria tritici ST99CH_3D1]SMY19513.1 unnamed protein product [Zymoseptoria tritici ST99CH_1A5]EGP92367.1 hypothetical protein MYCGRDRAFT_66031 [Zymoseptoria tritici IPO323]
MSNYNQYSGYGGNPYEQQQQEGAGGYGASNPYGGAAYNNGSSQQQQNYETAAPAPHAIQGNPAVPGLAVEYVPASRTVMSNSDFLSRVEAVKADIRTLTTHVGQIASAHQRTLSSPDTASSAQLESMISQTQVLNTGIKDQIKFLERDAAQSQNNNVKNTQVGQLKSSFNKQLQEYRVEELNYEKRYREQIARQYRIVNPEATEQEVQEASEADWGNEGVFQTALKSNRSATASTVLGSVRARHNDIQKIEKTLIELNQLMEDLATAVVVQEEAVAVAETHTAKVKDDTEAGNKQLDSGIASARRARKMKWWCLWICVAIVCIVALVLGLYFGVGPPSKN